MTELEIILENLKANNFVVIDDHKIDTIMGKPYPWKVDKSRKIAGVGTMCLDDGTVTYVVALLKGERYYSTNMLYIGSKDGKVHLSKMSVGPTVVSDNIQKANDSLYFGGGIGAAYWSDGSMTEYKLGVSKIEG